MANFSTLGKGFLGTFLGLQVLVLGGYTYYMGKNSYELKTKVDKDKKIVGEIKKINELLINTAKERGLSAKYLGGEESIKKVLDEQRQKVFKDIEQILKDKSINDPLLTKYLIKVKKQLTLTRPEIDAKNWSLAKEFKFYNRLNKKLLKIMFKRSKEVNYATDVKNIAFLAMGAENYGIIRGRVSYYLAAKKPLSLKLMEHLMLEHYIPLQYLETNTVLKVDFGLKNTVKRYMQEIIKSTVTHKPARLNSNLYWVNMTSLITKMKNAEDFYFKRIDQLVNTKMEQAKQLLILSIVMAIFTILLVLLTLMIVRSVNKYTGELERLMYNLSKTLGEGKGEEINLKTVKGIQKARRLIANTIEEMDAAKKQAEEMVKAKSLFLANMSHEIRTPLNGILGFLELLKTTELDETQEEYVNTVSQSAKNLLQIVNNILDVSKIESNKVTLELIDTKFTDEIENTIEIFGAPTAQKKIKYISFVDPSIPEVVKTDPVKIKEIMTNLLSNALKFTPEGGQIYVEISNKGINKDDDGTKKVKLYFEVRDTGIGMTETQKNKVFEAFSQADESVTRKYGGTGLGLTLVKNYIEMMGGEIKVESKVNKGTKFYFELEFEIVKEEPKYKEGIFSDKTFAVLVPDETSTAQSIMEKYLNYYGIKRVGVSSSDELNSIKSRMKIDATLVYYEYTDLSKVKSVLENRVPVIISTSYAYKESVESLNAITIFDPILENKIRSAVSALDSKKTLKAKTTAQGEVAKKHIYDLTALIAEDNPINQKLLKRTLEQMGIKCDIANNGLEAYTRYTSNPLKYDVIFMDMQMPILDGVEATKEILDFEQEEDIPHVPIVAATANALKNDRERFLGKGLDDYISKPIDRAELVKILENVVNGAYKNSERLAISEKQKSDAAADTEEAPVENPAAEAVNETPAVQETEVKNDTDKNVKEKTTKPATGKEVIVVTDNDFFADLFDTILPEGQKNITSSEELADTAGKIVIVAGDLSKDISDKIKNAAEVIVVENDKYEGKKVSLKEVEQEIKKIV